MFGRKGWKIAEEEKERWKDGERGGTKYLREGRRLITKYNHKIK